MIPEDFSKFQVKNIWVFTTDQGPDGEIVLTGTIENGQYRTFVVADIENLNNIMPLIREYSRLWKKSIKLYKFTKRELIETINPDGGEHGGN